MTPSEPSITPCASDGTPIGHTHQACARKKDYRTEAKAWTVIFKIRAQGLDCERLRPYQCDDCRKWHLGNQPPRMRAEISKAQREIRSVLPPEEE